MVGNSYKCAVGCVLCEVKRFVFLLWPVEVLSWEAAWCGGVVVLEMCVQWLEVASSTISSLLVDMI